MVFNIPIPRSWPISTKCRIWLPIQIENEALNRLNILLEQSVALLLNHEWMAISCVASSLGNCFSRYVDVSSNPFSLSHLAMRICLKWILISIKGFIQLNYKAIFCLNGFKRSRFSDGFICCNVKWGLTYLSSPLCTMGTSELLILWQCIIRQGSSKLYPITRLIIGILTVSGYSRYDWIT